MKLKYYRDLYVTTTSAQADLVMTKSDFEVGDFYNITFDLLPFDFELIHLLCSFTVIISNRLFSWGSHHRHLSAAEAA